MYNHSIYYNVFVNKPEWLYCNFIGSQSISALDSRFSRMGTNGGSIAGDIANAGLATAIMLSPLAAIICTFGEYLPGSSSLSDGTSTFR